MFSVFLHNHTKLPAADKEGFASQHSCAPNAFPVDGQQVWFGLV